jgi:hypothetical protein
MRVGFARDYIAELKRFSNALVGAVDKAVLALKVIRLRIQLLLRLLGSPILLTISSRMRCS